MNYFIFPHFHDSWFMPRWLWKLLPDSTKAKFRWYRKRQLPCMINLQSLDITKPHFRVRLLKHDDKIKPIVGYAKTEQELHRLLDLYHDRQPIVETYVGPNKWSRFTTSTL